MAKPKTTDLMSDAPYGVYGRSTMEILTPEGIILPFLNSSVGERFGALVLDFFIMAAAPVVLLLIWIALPLHEDFAKNHKHAEAVLEIVYLAFMFFIRSGYFIAFEMGAKAATPGKRAMRLRVISHDGGRLTPSAVFTRNALREIELYIPITIILAARSNPTAIGLVAFFWALALLLLPVFNQQHARLGDFLAGTRVVHMPKAGLSFDLADLAADRNLGLIFSTEQLAYGEKELTVLEQVLRERKPAVMRAVADKIKARINWIAPVNPSDMPNDETFLRAYYGALRSWLENKMLLGKRRKDKNDPAIA